MNNVNDSELDLESDRAIQFQVQTLGQYLGITFPWSFFYYFSDRGVENFHIYLWISKDLAWYAFQTLKMKNLRSSSDNYNSILGLKILFTWLCFLDLLPLRGV
jgi:hypothetical protein